MRFETPPDDKAGSGEKTSVLDPKVLAHLYNLKEEEIGPLKDEITSLEELIPSIKLDNVISLDNCPLQIPEDKERYTKRVMDGMDLGTPFSSDILHDLNTLEEKKPVVFESLKAKFKDVIIVDLGAGEGNNVDVSTGYRIACILGAKGYIGVEPFNWQSLFRCFLAQTKERTEIAGYGGKSMHLIPFNLVAEDAVTFMRRLPNDSVSLLNSGLSEILSEKTYVHDLKKEMARVLRPGAVCLISNSFNPEGLERTHENQASAEVKKFSMAYSVRFVEKPLS